MNLVEGFSLDEETKIRKKLEYLDHVKRLSNERTQTTNSVALRRLLAKLRMRNLKRKLRLKLFDLDAYTNELLDRERAQSRSKADDNDVIFEFKTYRKNTYKNSSTPEIIEITRILDRFKKETPSSSSFACSQNRPHILAKPPIGMVEWRNEDIKCILSPYTNKMLNPYIWRDFQSVPPKLALNNEIEKRSAERSASIDYVHLRPEHVLPINQMCELHFWNGIDISECLAYPDYTIVALYKKLIVGFAFLTPPSQPNNAQTKEMYLSFIFVHPDWRNHKVPTPTTTSTNVSLAQYMLFYLIKSCQSYDITLHVSVNSPAVLLYQKFGFQIDEFIQDFYDKYYSNEQNLSKNAFLMKLTRN